MTYEKLKPGYEIVYTVTDYYVGPRGGIVSYQGKPHVYECIFDESKDSYSELFRLAPIDEETFKLALEDWAIWQRWELAYYSGQTDIGTHPALPHEARSHAELKEFLDEALVIDPQRATMRFWKI